MRPGLPVGQSPLEYEVGGWEAARVTLDLLAGKWVMAVLAALANGGSHRRVRVLAAVGHGVSDKVLTETVRRMERDGLVSRREVANGQTAVYYRLTPRGRSLLDPVAALIRWEQTHAGQLGADDPAPDERHAGAVDSQ